MEELDAEMVDYFSNENAGPAEGNAPAPAAAPQPANGGEDLGMAEISVSFPWSGCAGRVANICISKCIMVPSIQLQRQVTSAKSGWLLVG